MNLVQQDFVDSVGYYIQSGRQALHVDTSEITRAEQGIKQAAEEISKPRAARITHLKQNLTNKLHSCKAMVVKRLLAHWLSYVIGCEDDWLVNKRRKKPIGRIIPRPWNL